jgi:hypothetical protein
MNELIKSLETAAAEFRRMSEFYLEQTATFERYAAEFKRIGKPRIRVVRNSETGETDYYEVQKKDAGREGQ